MAPVTGAMLGAAGGLTARSPRELQTLLARDILALLLAAGVVCAGLIWLLTGPATQTSPFVVATAVVSYLALHHGRSLALSQLGDSSPPPLALRRPQRVYPSRCLGPA